MDYKKYDTSDLRRFVKERKIGLALKPVSGHPWATSGDYIKALGKADRDFKFPFFDLSAELRNKIYEHLLDSGGLATAYPNILHTCKQVYNEASGILFVGNQFTIVIDGNGVTVEGVHCTGGLLRTSSPTFAAIDWPIFLAKARNLKVSTHSSRHFTYRRDPEPLAQTSDEQAYMNEVQRHLRWRDVARPLAPPPGTVLTPGSAVSVNHVMYSLCCYLDDHGSSPKFEIEIGESLCLARHARHAKDGEHYDNLASAFRPLRIMKSLNLAHVNIATLPEALLYRIRELWSEPVWRRLDTTPLRVWTNVTKWVKAADELGRQLKELLLFSTSVLPSTQLLADRLEFIVRWRTRSPYPHGRFITPQSEWELLEPLRALDAELDELDVEQVKAVIRDQIDDMGRREFEAMESTVRQLG